MTEIKKPDSALVMQRFVALAFCRADLLFELDHSHKIVFSAGTTKEFLGKGPGEISGQSFFDLIDEQDQKMMSDLLSSSHSDGRLDDISIRIPVNGGKSMEATLSGYRFPDLNNHLLIAVKIAPRKKTIPRRRDSDREEDSGILTNENFAEVAAERIRSVQKSGG